MCNKEIKFKSIFRTCIKIRSRLCGYWSLCTNRHEDGRVEMLRGVDDNKDQTYFLNQLSQEQLSKVMFPIGDIEKKFVKSLKNKT